MKKFKFILFSLLALVLNLSTPLTTIAQEGQTTATEQPSTDVAATESVETIAKIPEGVDSATWVAVNEIIQSFDGNIGSLLQTYKLLPKIVDSIGAFSLWDTFIYAFLVWAITLLGSRFEWARKITDVQERAIAFAISIAIAYSGLVYDFQLTFNQVFQYLIGSGIAMYALYPLLRAVLGFVTKKTKNTAPTPAT